MISSYRQCLSTKEYGLSDPIVFLYQESVETTHFEIQNEASAVLLVQLRSGWTS